MPRTGPLAAICALAALLLSLPGYASHDAPEYPVRPAAGYANKVVEPGFIVAIEPLEDPEQQKTYFNDRLSSKGMLPVFIVIQNTSTTDSYLFDESAVGLGDAPEVTGKGARRNATRLGSGGLIDLTLFTDVTQTRENLMRKEIRSKTLSAGSSVSGFVYVPVPTDAPRESCISRCR